MSKKHYKITATTYDRRGRKIAIGVNDYAKTHTRQAELATRVGMPARQYLHAEIAAIVKSAKVGRAPYKIKIERYTADGLPKLAKPCKICELAIKEAGITLVEYTVG